jgi:hypothetical protein
MMFWGVKIVGLVRRSGIVLRVFIIVPIPFMYVLDS